MTRFVPLLPASHRRGTAMVLAILLSVVLTSIVMCLALSATMQSNTTSSLARSDAAFYAAEYAMQDTLWRFKADNTYRASLNSPRTMNLTLGGMTYNCSVSCIDSVGFPTIEWKFNEGAGGTAADNSGNGNTGSLNNCSWNASAREGASCLYLNGTDSYVNCGSSPSTNLSGDVTMSAWIKLTNASYDQKIGGNQNGTYGGYKFYIYNSKVIFEVRAADNTSTRNKNQPGGTVLAVNTWYHELRGGLSQCMSRQAGHAARQFLLPVDVGFDPVVGLGVEPRDSRLLPRRIILDKQPPHDQQRHPDA